MCREFNVSELSRQKSSCGDACLVNQVEERDKAGQSYPMCATYGFKFTHHLGLWTIHLDVLVQLRKKKTTL